MTDRKPGAGKRGRGRDRVRLQVRYGPQEPTHLGYTMDVSEKGLFLQGPKIYPPGTELQLRLTLPEGSRVIRGTVRWIKTVPVAFRHRVRGGMGVEIVAEVPRESEAS